MTQPKLVFLLWASVWLSIQRAQAHSVTIRRLADREAPTAEVATRLRGELLAMGVRAEVGAARRLTSTGVHWDSDAVMHVTGSATELRVEIWVRVAPDEFAPWIKLEQSRSEDNAPEKLAIRAAEAFHSRFGQVEPEPSKRPAPKAKREVEQRATDDLPLSEESQPSVASPEAVSRRPRLALGGTALLATRGLSAALMPLVRFEWPLWEPVVPYVTLAGLGSKSNTTTNDGGARVAWNYGLIGVNYYAGTLGIALPFMGVGVGGSYTSIQGQASAPLTAHDSEQLVWLAELTVGALIPVSRRYYFTIAGHAQFTTPTTVVHVLDETAAVSGRPNWSGSLAAGVRL